MTYIVAKAMSMDTAEKNVDGDELVLKIHLDKYTADMWKTTRPHYSAIDPNQPLTYSSDLNLPKPIVTQFYRWLGYDKL
jgi:hypothetical protein